MAIIVYDLESTQNWEYAKKWIEIIQTKNSQKKSPIEIVLVRNKKDLSPEQDEVYTLYFIILYFVLLTIFQISEFRKEKN